MVARRAMRVLAAVLAASFLAAGVALAAASGPAIDWWVIGAGGGSQSAGTSWLGGTTGQWVAGSDAVSSTQQDAGFWAGVGGGHIVFMPLVLRQT